MLRRLPVLINLISIKSKLSSVKLRRKNFHVRYYSQMKPTLQLRIDTILIVLENCVKILSIISGLLIGSLSRVGTPRLLFQLFSRRALWRQKLIARKKKEQPELGSNFDSSEWKWNNQPRCHLITHYCRSITCRPRQEHKQ